MRVDAGGGRGYADVDARNTILRHEMRISGTERTVERTCADHMLVLGRHDSGCVSTLEVVGGTTATPFRFELEGERGALKIVGGHVGGFQAGVLSLETDVEGFAAPTSAAAGLVGPPCNVAEAHARLAADIRHGTRTVPNFDAAVRLSRLLERITAASDTGKRQEVA